MDTVVCKEVVITTLTRRGKGISHSPIRIITEIFEKDGTKIAEHDPSPETFALSDMIDFAVWCIKNGIDVAEITRPCRYVYQWLDEKYRNQQ